MATPKPNVVLLPSSKLSPRAHTPPRQIGWRNGKSPTEYALGLIERVCAMAGSGTLLTDLATPDGKRDLTRAIARHDTLALYDWLAVILSYQGVSDQVARSYLDVHGSVTWREIEQALSVQPPCPKLRSHWHYVGCRYDKSSRSCAEPEHLEACPVPMFRLRNGRLNQTAFSLYFFIRDIADGDLVRWIDGQLATPATACGGENSTQDRLLAAMRHIYGVSDKLLTMALSSLLLAGPTHWHHASINMIAIDTLVHNFLLRTGILDRFGARHLFGPRCYAANGCASIIRHLADQIDAHRFNKTFPQTFPRFVQHAIWRYCAQGGLNVCNGNQIDDRTSCQNIRCQLFRECDRIALSRQKSRENR